MNKIEAWSPAKTKARPVLMRLVDSVDAKWIDRQYYGRRGDELALVACSEDGEPIRGGVVLTVSPATGVTRYYGLREDVGLPLDRGGIVRLDPR